MQRSKNYSQRAMWALTLKRPALIPLLALCSMLGLLVALSQCPFIGRMHSAPHESLFDNYSRPSTSQRISGTNSLTSLQQDFKSVSPWRAMYTTTCSPMPYMPHDYPINCRLLHASSSASKGG